MTFALGPNLSAQGTVWIWDQPHGESARRILPKGIMVLMGRLIHLSIVNGSPTELLSMICGLWTDAEDGHVIFPVSFVLVDKGRNLGSTPWSPLATVEKDDRCRCLCEDCWELNYLPINILQFSSRKFAAKL